MTARDRIAIGAVVALAALAAYWFMLLGPRREEASALQKQVAEQRVQLSAAQLEVAAAQAARSEYAENYATVARLGKAVPADDESPALVYQLEKAADSAGIDFRAIKLAQGAAGAAAPPPPPPPPSQPQGATGPSGPSGPTGAAGTTGATGAGSAPAAATQAATAALPPGATVGSAGFPTMPFSFTFDGSFFRMSDFFGRLQDFVAASNERVAVSGRLLQIDGFSFGAGSEGFPKIKAAVAATAYLLPEDQGLTAGATPAAPGQSASQPAAGGSAPSVPAPATAGGPLK